MIALHRPFILAFASLSVLGTLSPSARSFPLQPAVHAPDNPRKEIEANYSILRKSIETGDVRTFTPLVSPNFRYTSPFGFTAVKDEWIAQLLSATRGMRNVKVSLKLEEVTPKEDSVTALYNVRLTADAPDPKTPGRVANVEVRYLTRDNWTKVGNLWQLQSSSDLKEDTFIRGVLFRPEEKAEDAAARLLIQNDYDALVKLYNAKDFAGIVKVLPAKVPITTVDGALFTQDRLFAQEQEKLTNATEISMTLTVDRLLVDGEKAIALRQKTLTYKAPDEKGKVNRRTETTYSRETYQKTQQTWTLKESEELFRITK